jgi:hypothetical protein
MGGVRRLLFLLRYDDDKDDVADDVDDDSGACAREDDEDDACADLSAVSKMNGCCNALAAEMRAFGSHSRHRARNERKRCV